MATNITENTDKGNKDETIKALIVRIEDESEEFLNYVNATNQCAYTDRMVENIIALAHKLEATYNI